MSCSKQGGRTSNIMNVVLTDDVPTLDPVSSYDTVSARVVYQIYETLYQYHYLKRPYKIIPGLADGFPKVTNGGTRYIIKLKKGVRYHDDPVFQGKPRYVKAQDFINQIKRLSFQPSKSSGQWLFDGKIKGLSKFRDTVKNNLADFFKVKVEGLSAPDDHTLVIDLTHPDSELLYSFTMTFTSPMPMEAIKAYNNNLSNRAIGTGAFRLDHWDDTNGSIKLVRFKDYHSEFYPIVGDRRANTEGLLKDARKKLPFLDGVKFVVHKESKDRWENFLSKKIDFIIVPRKQLANVVNSGGNISQKIKDQNIKLQTVPTLTYWWVSFNMKDPLIGKNRNLRLAIAHAIDMEQLISIFVKNTGQKANSIFPPGILGYRPSDQLPYSYNVKKAKEYLAQAGFPGGKGLPTLKFDTRGKSETNQLRAQFYQSQLKKIGVNIEIVYNTFPKFINRVGKEQLQIWQGGWAMDYPTPENILQLLITKNHPPGPNASFFSNPEFDKLYDQLKMTTTSDQKKALLGRMKKIVNNDIPWIMAYYARNYTVYHDYLKNYRNSDIIFNYMKYLRID